MNIASLLSFQGGITVPAYAAPKGGVAQLTKALANEWAGGRQRQRDRARLHAHRQHRGAAGGPDAQPADPGAHPRRRWGEPADLAGAAVFLASPASDYVNGHVLVVDGGWMGR